jgi:threonyl-tRNA synthetase
VIATIVTDANDYAEKVAEACRDAGLRVELDLRNEKIGYKVREHSLQKVPAILCIGMREAEEGSVAVRRFGSKEQTLMPAEKFIQSFTEEIDSKGF